MSWTEELYKIYEYNSGREFDEGEPVMLPVAHSTANAQIELTIGEHEKELQDTLKSADSAMEELNLTVGSLIDIKEAIDSYEAEHETNLSRPMGVKNKPVQIPMTDEMISKVDTMLDVAEKAILALEIAEFTTLENQSEVQNSNTKKT